MRNLAALLLLSTSLFLFPSPSEAQFRWGGHMVHAARSFGGATGAGLRAGIDVPVMPLDLVASGEYFFPDCPQGMGGCGLQGITLDANFRMLTPLVRPYGTGGLAYRRLSPGGEAPSQTESGIALGVGIDASLGTLRGFGEARWEFVGAPRNQLVWRLGVLMGLP